MSSSSTKAKTTKAKTTSATKVDGITLAQSFQNNCGIVTPSLGSEEELFPSNSTQKSTKKPKIYSAAEIRLMSPNLPKWPVLISMEEFNSKFPLDTNPCLEFKPRPGTPVEPPPPELCKSCSTVHSAWGLCPGMYCEVCFSESHLSSFCPFFEKLPRGAKFDRSAYTVFCRCGCPFFDMDNWACRAKLCESTTARLQIKRCEICGTGRNHTTYECTENKDEAAQIKKEDEAFYFERNWSKCEEYIPFISSKRDSVLSSI